MIARDVDDAIESARAFLGKDADGRTPAELAAIGPAVEPPRRQLRRFAAPEQRQRRADQRANHQRPDWMADPDRLPRQPPRPVPHPTPVGEWARRQAVRP